MSGEASTSRRRVRLKYLAKLNPPVPACVADDLEVSFLPMEAIGEDGSLDLSRRRPAREVRSSYSYFADGDVAYAKVTPCFENGKGAVMRGLASGHGFGTTELTVMRPTGAAHTHFLNYVLSSQPFRQGGAGAMTGAGGLKRVPDKFAANFVVVLPSTEEQAALVAKLDRETARIDALIEKKTRFIELLREKRQALITQAVTQGLDASVPMKDSGVEWLGRVPAHWEVLNFQRVVAIAEGQVDPEQEPYRSMLLIAPNHVESGTGRLIARESAVEQRAESGKYQCNVGDVVYSKIRPALRKACIAPESCLCSADMYPLRGIKGMTNPYLLWFLLSEPFSAFAVLEADRVAMPKINRDSLSRLKVPLPPTSEQAAICAKVGQMTSSIDRLIDRTNKSVALLAERRSALITAAVTGQIDLREAA